MSKIKTEYVCDECDSIWFVEYNIEEVAEESSPKFCPWCAAFLLGETDQDDDDY